MSNKIYTYKDMVNELAIINKEIKKFDNLSKIKDSKLLLKKMNQKLEEIKEELKNITWQQIKLLKIPFYDKNKNSYHIKWNGKIDLQLSRLSSLVTNLEDKDDDVFQKLKIDTQRLIIDFLEIDIEPNFFNSIHFPIDLPDFYKNIGLGVKIFRKCIEQFDFVSSSMTGSEQASFDAKLVFHHFFSSNDVYSVTKNNSGILLINKNMNIQKIKELVVNYLKDADEYAIDKDLKKMKIFKNLNDEIK